MTEWKYFNKTIHKALVSNTEVQTNDAEKSLDTTWLGSVEANRYFSYNVTTIY